MKITSFEYKDHSVDWTLEHIEFGSLTLLVGASGVGKTRLLQALIQLKKIAQGKSPNGVQWEIKFSGDNGQSYQWHGLFEKLSFLEQPFLDVPGEYVGTNRPNIESEKLYIDEKLVVDRNQKGIVFNGEKTVKLSPKESVISLLKEENQIKVVYLELSKILFNNAYEKRQRFPSVDISENEKNLRGIRNSDANLRIKLYWIYLNVPKKFEEIKNTFVDIFPYIEDVKIAPLINHYEKRLPVFERIPFIQIKEHGIQNWIEERYISSGMYRTLLHIAELHLCADGAVILIDEFENSLGINCIDEITENIIMSDRNLQFIITSHHPYIINNISSKNWKIITRKAGVVKNHDADQLNIGRSKHQSFTQLINCDEYSSGIES